MIPFQLISKYMKEEYSVKKKLIDSWSERFFLIFLFYLMHLFY